MKKHKNSLPTLRMFSVRSSALKLRSPLRPCLILSPSRMYVRYPLWCSSRLREQARVLLPKKCCTVHSNFDGNKIVKN